MRTFWLIALSLLLSGCGYSRLTEQKELLGKEWAQLEALHAERANLAAQLAGQLENRGAFDTGLLAKVSQASSKVKGIGVNAANDASLRGYERLQGDLRSALAQLMTATQASPVLQAAPGIHDVMARLESTNNRIRTAQAQYAASVSTYNADVGRAVTARVFGFAPVPQISLESPQPVSDAPVIDFAKGTPRRQ